MTALMRVWGRLMAPLVTKICQRYSEKTLLWSMLCVYCCNFELSEGDLAYSSYFNVRKCTLMYEGVL